MAAEVADAGGLGFRAFLSQEITLQAPNDATSRRAERAIFAAGSVHFAAEDPIS
jgi:hypothetical protein